MKTRRIVDWPGERALYEELYAGLRVTMPALERRAWPEPSGVVAGYERGQLVGFVVFFAAPARNRTAAVQWILVRRERDRLESGFNTTYPARADEVEALAILVGAAADEAREAGYRLLEWGDAEVDLAARLGARMDAEGLDGLYQLTLDAAGAR